MQHFVIRTDHEAIKSTIEQKITTSLQQKWVSKLLRFDYSVLNKKGGENLVVDALSWIHEDDKECAVVTVLQPLWKKEMVDSIEGDNEAREWIAKVTVAGGSLEGYSFEGGILKKNDKYYVGSRGQLRERICETIHCIMKRDHLGIAGSIKRAESLFYWPGLRKDITTFFKECDVCQRNKLEHVPSPGILQPIQIPDKAWEVISMDFIEGFPKSVGKDSILLVVDKLTKYCHLIPLTHPFSA